MLCAGVTPPSVSRLVSSGQLGVGGAAIDAGCRAAGRSTGRDSAGVTLAMKSARLLIVTVVMDMASTSPLKDVVMPEPCMRSFPHALARPRRARGRLPPNPLTRFAPSPTGYLHLGHVANAVCVWGVARALGGRVLLRLEDHDRGRSRPEYERAVLEDLEWLGLVPDRGTAAELRAGPVALPPERLPRRLRAALEKLAQYGAGVRL